jgi:hypothetical protein
MRNSRKGENVNYNKEAVKNFFIVKSEDETLKSLKSETGYTKINPATFVTFKD